MPNNPNLVNEEHLPSNLEPVESVTQVPGKAPIGAPAPPMPNDMPQFFSGSMPPQLQHDSSFVGTEVASPRIPKFSLMPLGIQANPSTNAAIQSTATKVVQATPPSSGGGSQQITLNIPAIFTPITQTVTLPGPLAFSLATELPGTVFKAPSPGLTGLTGVFGNSFSIQGSTGATQSTITFTPSVQPGWAFFMEALSGNSNTPPPGWTAWGAGAVLSFSSLASITATDTVATSFSWANGVVTFSGARPALVQSLSGATILGGSGGSVSVTGTNGAGNTLICSIHGGNGLHNTANFTIRDSNGNNYTLISSGNGGSNSFGGPPQFNVFIATNIAAGSNTVTVSIGGGPFGGGAGYTLDFVEIGPLSSGPGTPLFQPLSPSDLPSINASQIVGGQLSNRWGGTGADLHATGGAHQVVMQESAGAPFTVRQLDYPDLAGLAVATTYAGNALVANGLVSEVAIADPNIHLGAITTTLLYATPATGTGWYKLSWVARVTLASGGGGSSTIGPLTITYTDPDSTAYTITAAAQSGTGTMETSDSTNTASTIMFGVPLLINAKALTSINYAFAYASVPLATMAYSLHIKLEAL